MNALSAIGARHSGRRPSTKESFVVPQDDCLEMYYYWGVARNEMGQYDQAFEALRQAINEDHRNQRDESLSLQRYLIEDLA